MSAEDIDLALVNDALTERVQRETTSVQTEWTGRVTSKDLEGVYYVDITGGATAMPCVRSLVDVRIGQIVDVRIQNGHAVITGCRSDPVATSSSVNVVEKKVTTVRNEVQIIRTEKADVTELNAVRANVEELHAQYGEFETVVTQDLLAVNADITNLKAKDAEITGQLTAANADITNLKAKDVTIEGNLSAATGRIGTLESDNVTVKGRLDAAEADIDDLEAEDARIGNLVAGKADITDLTAATGRITVLESTKANISDLEANYITAADIEAQYMHANMSNSDVAWIQNGVIKDGAISSAMINDVSANKLTAGTINGSVINVTNLNADNITTGTINGQRIGEGSLSLDKLSEDVYTESEVDAKLNTMQQQIDGAIETWTGTTVPTLQNTPASSWTTVELKDQHVGDVYFVVNSQSQQNGYNYRFTKTGSTYSWQLIKDSDVTAALSRLDAAEGKITTFDSDISTLKTDTGTLTTKTTSLETRMSDAESDILDKVDTTTFNEVSDTVDSHSESISQMTQTLSNKADGSTVTALTTRVNKTETDISGINTTIGELQTTVASKADGSTVETISSKLNTVSDTVDGHTQTISSVQGVAENANNKAVAYSATSSTGSTTAAKVAACTNFPALAAGVTVTVRFSNASTATGALTLNVNSTGAKTIYVNGSATSSTNQLLWGANANVTFTYDGSYWRVDSEPRSWYGTCSIAAGTAAKTSTIAEAVICKGTNVTLNMTNENTNTSATLNITSTGAKNIYYGTTTTRPTTANGYGWTAASTVTFVFDGAYWRLGDTSALAGLASVKSTVTEHTTSIQQNAEAIQTKASASDLNALTGRVSTAESTITQQAGQIEAKVSKDGVIAAINLSSESATISADKVNITGTAIFSALGSNNKVVTATQTQWYSSTSATSKSGGSWATTQPSIVAGRYIWQREYITYSDGSHEYKPSEAGVCVQGQTDLSAYSTTEQANALYDSAGSASAAQAAAISAAASDATSKANAAEQNAKAAIPTDISDLNNDTGFITSEDVPTKVSELQNDSGYQNSTQVSTAVSNGTANLAAKADAVARTQRIYYRQTASGSAPGANTTWLSTSGTGYGNWSLSIPQLTNGETKYPKLYMATQTQTVAQQAAGSTCTCTTPALDDSTTVIDGGNIVTGTIDASKATITNINGANITAGTLSIGQVNNLQDTLNEMESDLTNEISEQSAAAFTVADNIQGQVTTILDGLLTSTYFVQDGDSYTFNMLETTIDGLTGDLAEISSYVRIETEDGSPVLKLGSSEAPVYAALSNSALEFRTQAGNVIAYFLVEDGVGKLKIDNAVILQELQFGDWKWTPRANGNLSLKWIGA